MPTNNDDIKEKYGFRRDSSVLEVMLNEARSDTAKQIFKELDSFIEPMKIYDEDGTEIEMPTMNLVKYLEYQKKYKVNEK